MTVAVFNHKVVDIGIGVRFADIFVLVLKQRVYDENIVEQSDSRRRSNLKIRSILKEKYICWSTAGFSRLPGFGPISVNVLVGQP